MIDFAIELLTESINIVGTLVEIFVLIKFILKIKYETKFLVKFCSCKSND